MDKILYTKIEVAKLTGLGVRTVERMITAGQIKVIRPGGPNGHVRIPRAELDRLAAGEEAPK